LRTAAASQSAPVDVRLSHVLLDGIVIVVVAEPVDDVVLSNCVGAVQSRAMIEGARD